ncbi:MAG TPA: divalent metal cation transporter [Solirubrobacterales bacterium]|nr:divalent metal cation transporter [Solirubrobacterales bacterium]
MAVVGPGLLASLSDDDPAGIATYSILGAEYGYRLLWVLTLSTAALIVFHELAVRLGIVTGKGLLTLVRERYGPRAAGLVLAALVIANTGTPCAEFAGVAAAMELLGGMSRYLSVPLGGDRRLSAGPARELPPRRAHGRRSLPGGSPSSSPMPSTSASRSRTCATSEST